MSHKFIELSTGSIRYVLPWHAPTIIHAIQSNHINVSHLFFSSRQDKHKLSHDLFLLATYDCLKNNSQETSPLALIARELMS